MFDQGYAAAVNSVISMCKHAQQAFEGAAQAVHSSSLKTVFHQYSTQRAGFVRVLQDLLHKSGEQAAYPATAPGTVNGDSSNPKYALTRHNEEQILRETQRRERLSLKAYRDALSEDLPVPIRAVLERQLSQVEEACNWIERLRNKTAETAMPI